MIKGTKMQINPEQEKAVKHDSGPILVVAGAGTGKTRVISERIKYLIKHKKIDPKDILALTFTEKAAQEMSDRVADVMPLGYEEPWVTTFHSFADRILKKEGIEIGLDPSYKILSGPDQWLLVKRNLFSFDLKYFLPLGNPTKFISAILKFISRLQDEYISPSDLEEFVKNSGYEGEEKERWEELTHIYGKYQEVKIAESKLDFGDLITWLIKLFEQRPNLLKKYKEQFKHVLVDEFQDTNYAQYMLVKSLCPNDLGTKENGKRSLLTVGDDSQSIYKFRGAAVSNILEFMKDYPEAEMVTLTENYRSTQDILDPAYKLIQNNNPDTLESKLGISKELISKIEESSGEVPQSLQAETLEDEVELVISKIYEVLAKEPSYTYKDVAILARANNHLSAYVMALRKYGLPYQLVGNRGLYDQDEVRNVMAMLKVVVNPKDSTSLYRVLNIDSFEIPQRVVTSLLSSSKYKKVDLWTLIPDNTNEQLQDFYQLIIKYQDEITKTLPVQFVFNLVHESRYLGTYLEEETIENHLSIKNLDLFLNKIKKFEVDYQKETKELPTIVDLVDYVDSLIEAGDNPAQAELEDIDTINLLTVHSAKGLEFPVVFMTNLVAGRFPTRNRKDTIEIPDELVKETLPTGDEHIQEERRLFYVGMTRAMKYLFMMTAKNYGGKRERKPSGYINETGIELKEESPSSSLSKKVDQKTLFGVESKFRDPVFADLDFTPKFLSYSQLDMYKLCPLRYKYSYVLRVPSAPSHNLSFGISIHDTLRDFHSKLLFKDVSLEDLLKMYDQNWQPLGYENEEHRNLRYESGKELLEKYYERHKDDKTKPLEIEKAFNITLGGVRFYGRIDRIDPDNDGVEIIDYKTGNTKTQKDVDKDSQVAYYAIGTKEALGMDAKKLTYYYLESGERISTTRTEEQLKKTKKEAEGLIENIKKGEFNAKPGMHCSWCDYKNICPFTLKS
ncbi:ATP-dependent helicase [Patescibacteria group bacterium]